MSLSTSTTSLTDTLCIAADNALRTLFATPRASRPCPCPQAPSDATNPEASIAPLSDIEAKHAAGLMRVNHVGEICAQALYTAQSMTMRQATLRAELTRAAREEIDHLAWTQTRLTALKSKPSVLNPLWYAGAFGLGLLAGRLGDAWSLGFVVETEKQVEAHLASHLDALPAHDHASRAIVLQMKLDEAQHGQLAKDAGGRELPAPIKHAMSLAAKVMTKTAYWL